MYKVYFIEKYIIIGKNIYINVRQFCYKWGWVSESMLHFGWMLKIMRRDSWKTVFRSLIQMLDTFPYGLICQWNTELGSEPFCMNKRQL